MRERFSKKLCLRCNRHHYKTTDCTIFTRCHRCSSIDHTYKFCPWYIYRPEKKLSRFASEIHNRVCIKERRQAPLKINDILRQLSDGFQNLDIIENPNDRNMQLQELTEKIRDCERLIVEFQRIIKEDASNNTPETTTLLNDMKKRMITGLRCLLFSNAVTVIQTPHHHDDAAVHNVASFLDGCIFAYPRQQQISLLPPRASRLLH